MRVITDPDKKCKFCQKPGPDFTYWPADRPGCRNLLCKKCAAEFLTKEGFEERFNEPHQYK